MTRNRGAFGALLCLAPAPSQEQKAMQHNIKRTAASASAMLFAFNTDPLFDETLAGAYLGGVETPVSPRTLQRWRLEGTGPVWVRLGRLVRYRQSALDAFLNDGVRRSTSQVA